MKSEAPTRILFSGKIISILYWSKKDVINVTGVDVASNS